ncbi:MAG TPA: PAAR domain-containing protein [Pyrinomonadaceae bacterium]|jgi:uncharacterized Zn-binding protein involved in type VI secretion|nr:PAAR domain-containing protein [Pyrinomonadaceae bacterium]
MFPAARVTDPLTHDMVTPCGTISTGSPNVQIELMPAAYVTSTVACTGVIAGGIAHPPPPAPVPIIPPGALFTLINRMPAARWAPSGDIAACGVFLGNPALIATRKTLIGK